MQQVLYINGGAEIDGDYRYRLWRDVGGAGREVLWVMLNPSTADGQHNDATIRKCIRFSQLWGYGRFTVMNLFAFRATDPKDMKAAADPVGPRNDDVLAEGMARAKAVVVAWGANGSFRDRDLAFADRHAGVRFQCLGVTKDGSPQHPLYIPYDRPLTPWTPRTP